MVYLSRNLVWGLHTTCEAVSTRGISVFVPGISELQVYGRIAIWRWDPVLPGCGGTAPPRWAYILAGWRWLYEIQLITAFSHWNGIGVSTTHGAVSNRESSFFVTGLSDL